MTTFAVQYSYVDDAAALAEHRPDHRAFLGGLANEGVLLASGPWASDGPPGALLLLRGASAQAVRELLAADPFQRQGLVAAVDVRGWTPVLGRWATQEPR